MNAVIKWNNITGNKISVNRGTRQGGLTSPFIFNLFYQNLIDKLNTCNCGITIGGYNYNAICYADDILSCSTTSSGLQTLINSERQRGVKRLAKRALQVESVIHSLDSLSTYRGRYACLPIMHSNVNLTYRAQPS